MRYRKIAHLLIFAVLSILSLFSVNATYYKTLSESFINNSNEIRTAYSSVSCSYTNILDYNGGNFTIKSNTLNNPRWHSCVYSGTNGINFTSNGFSDHLYSPSNQAGGRFYYIFDTNFTLNANSKIKMTCSNFKNYTQSASVDSGIGKLGLTISLGYNKTDIYKFSLYNSTGAGYGRNINCTSTGNNNTGVLCCDLGYWIKNICADSGLNTLQIDNTDISTQCNIPNIYTTIFNFISIDYFGWEGIATHYNDNPGYIKDFELSNIITNESLPYTSLTISENQLPICNITNVILPCLNNSLSYNPDISCTDAEGDTIYYGFIKNYRPQYILNPVYMDDIYGDTNYRYSALYTDDNLANAHNTQYNTTLCDISTGGIFGWFNSGGIYLVDLTNKNRVQSVGALKLVGADCDTTANYKRVISYRTNEQSANAVIDFKFYIENNSDSTDRKLLFRAFDSNKNSMSGYYVMRNSTNDNVEIWKHLTSEDIYLGDFPSSISDETIFYGIQNWLTFSTNTQYNVPEDRTVIYYNVGGNVIVVYNDSRTPDVTGYISGFEVYPYQHFADSNMTFYIGDLKIYENKDTINWNTTLNSIVYDKPGTYNTILYTTDSVHKDLGIYNTTVFPVTIQSCDRYINPNDIIKNPDARHAVDVINNFNSVLCREGNRIYQDANRGTGVSFDLCKGMARILYVIAVILAIVVTVGIYVFARFIPPEIAIGLFAIFHLVFLITFRFISPVDYDSWLKILSGIIISVCISIMIRFIIFGGGASGASIKE